MNKITPEIERSYVETTNPPKELIFADNSDFPTLRKVERELLKSIMKETLSEDDLIVNEDKTEETIINRLKDKNDEEWRKTKKLGSLLGCYEDMKRRIQLSYAAFNTIKKIWYHRKIHINKKLQLYKSTVKPILSIKNYNYINLQSNQYYYIVQQPGDLQRKNKMKLMLLIVDS